MFATAFLFVGFLAWLYPITPSGDGPYQTLNWISRIKEGQVPGRDFDVFHGVGVLWVHAILAVPFGSVRGLIWVHYLGSLFLQWLLWNFVLKSTGRPWKRASLESAAVCGIMNLTMGIPLGNVSILVSGGNSMVGARVALPLICLFIAQRMIRPLEKGGGLRSGVFMGAAAGAGAWFATDQAPASLIMGIVISVSVVGSASVGSRSLRLICSFSAIVMVVAMAMFTYLLLLWLTTGGSVEACLTYWWSVLPQVQFWYFGGAPNAYFHDIRDLLNPTILVLLSASLGLHWIGWKLRYHEQVPLRLGLIAYGLVSLLPLMGMLFPHYISGLWCTGLVGLLTARRPDRLVDFLLSRASLRAIKISLGLICAVLSVRAAQVQWKHKSRCLSPDMLPLRLSGAISEGDSSAVPDVVRTESMAHPSSNTLRAFYRGVPEIILRQPGVGRFDYIIHALGDQQHREYIQALKSSPPLYLRVPCQKSYLYSQWLWHQWPDLWEDVITGYRFQEVFDGSAYWKKVDREFAAERSPVVLKVNYEGGTAVIRSEGSSLSGGLLHVTVAYHTEKVQGPFASLVDRMTRVTLRSSGVLDEQPFSWQPCSSAKIRDFYLIPKGGQDIEIRMSAEGPIFSSRLVVTSAVAERVKGVDIDGLAKTLEP